MEVFQSVDLASNFYFSYTYDITHTLQKNLTKTKNNPDLEKINGNILPHLNSIFVWNYQLISNGKSKLGIDTSWMIPLIHGYTDQFKLSILGRNVYVTLIARRSRVFAGVRFMKRGVNEKGYVANDVETEQIVHTMEVTSFSLPFNDENSNPSYTSFVQHRGSIPLFWSQYTSAIKPKPPIELNIQDPYFTVSGIHFQQLFIRYGTPIIVLSLIKTKESTRRESLLGEEFSECISYLNKILPKDKKLLYIRWDMSRAKNNREDDVLEILEEIAEESLTLTGFFHNGPELYTNYLKKMSLYQSEKNEKKSDGSCMKANHEIPMHRKHKLLQNGVIRSNCIDCLDRTNAAQTIIGKVAFAHQLYELGCLSEPYLAFDTEAVMMLEEMYHDLGDTIALQYGGSHLVNTVQTYRKINNWTSHSRDLIVSLRRYYSNSFVDAERQNAITMFLEKSDSSTNDVINNITIDADDPFHSNDIALGFLKKRPEKEEEITKPDHPIDFEEISVGDDRLSLVPIESDIGFMEKTDSKSLNSDYKFDYWSEYYNPKTYTSFDSLFLSRINSNSKYDSFLLLKISSFITRNKLAILIKYRPHSINSGPFVSKSVDNDSNEIKKIRTRSKWLNAKNDPVCNEEIFENFEDLSDRFKSIISKEDEIYPYEEFEKLTKTTLDYSFVPLEIPTVSEESKLLYKRYIDQFYETAKYYNVETDEFTKIGFIKETYDPNDPENLLIIPTVDSESQKLYDSYVNLDSLESAWKKK
ncbi:Polyphosphoinositide phosphatase [Smittium mucronatum]|uniref:Polyphosphoinositide phosphatase n=1 Tax=Smittium mucronatum TaxID=133383 RepID=A0A1R0GMP4_9FUNG|nr:Polyphosphoinositide phosphatase [Smittium mucronatum]